MGNAQPFRLNERYQVQGLTKDSSALPAIRKAIAKSGAYGPVSVDQFHGGPPIH